MSDVREFLTPGEVEAVAHRIVDAKVTAMHQEMRDALKEQKVILDRLSDGAQASIYSATVLHGNPEVGLKGFIPEMIERMAAVEHGQKIDRELVESHHRDNTEEFQGIKARLTHLEEGQHNTRNLIKKLCGPILNGDDGRPDIRKLAPVAAAAAGAVASTIYAHLSWAAFKRWLLHLMGG